MNLTVSLSRSFLSSSVILSHFFFSRFSFMMKLDWLLLRIVICSCVKQVDFLIFFFFYFLIFLNPLTPLVLN